MIFAKRIFEFVLTYFPGERFRDLEAKQISVKMEKVGTSINEVMYYSASLKMKFTLPLTYKIVANTITD